MICDIINKNFSGEKEMTVELNVNVVNVAMECIAELNAKPGNSMEKSTNLINLYNMLNAGISEANNRLIEKQRVDNEAKKLLAEGKRKPKEKPSKDPEEKTEEKDKPAEK